MVEMAVMGRIVLDLSRSVVVQKSQDLQSDLVKDLAEMDQICPFLQCIHLDTSHILHSFHLTVSHLLPHHLAPVSHVRPKPAKTRSGTRRKASANHAEQTIVNTST